MRKIKLSGFMFSLLAISLLTACPEQHVEPLRIASSPWPGYEPLYLARDLGYLKPELFRLFELPSSDITMESFRNRSTDVASLTLDETLELLQDGTRLKIILIMDVSHGGDAVMAAPGINKLSDIRGKRISIVNIPLGLYMLNRLLDKAGVGREEVEVSLMPETHQLKFYQQGKADVVITYDPVKTHLKNEGMHVLFDSADIPNEIFDILVVHEDVYKTHREQLCSLVNEWFRSLDYVSNNHQEAMRQISRRLGVDTSEVEHMMQGIVLPGREENHQLLGGKAPKLLESADRLEKIMREQQLLSGVIDASHAIDPDFVNCRHK